MTQLLAAAALTGDESLCAAACAAASAPSSVVTMSSTTGTPNASDSVDLSTRTVAGNAAGPGAWPAAGTAAGVAAGLEPGAGTRLVTAAAAGTATERTIGTSIISPVTEAAYDGNLQGSSDKPSQTVNRSIRPAYQRAIATVAKLETHMNSSADGKSVVNEKAIAQVAGSKRKRPTADRKKVVPIPPNPTAGIHTFTVNFETGKLGLSFQIRDSRALVMEVVEAGAASFRGVLPEDEIIGLGGLAFTNVQDLHAVLSQAPRPIAVTFRRSLKITDGNTPILSVTSGNQDEAQDKSVTVRKKRTHVATKRSGGATDPPKPEVVCGNPKISLLGLLLTLGHDAPGCQGPQVLQRTWLFQWKNHQLSLSSRFLDGTTFTVRKKSHALIGTYSGPLRRR